MIHCPYCGSEMQDTARACPQCRSLMVENIDSKKKEFPKALHPLTVLAVIVILSITLAAIDLTSGRPGPKKEKGGMAAGMPPGEEMPESAEERVPRNAEEKGVQEASGVEPSAELYTELMDYEAAVSAIITEADSLVKRFRDLVKENDGKKAGELTMMLKEFQVLTSRVRSLSYPEPVRRSHTRLANSFAIRQRGLKNMLLYVESGDVQRLDRGRRDLETADSQKDMAMREISAAVESYKPPESELQPPAPPPEEPETTTAPQEGGTAEVNAEERESESLIDRMRRQPREPRERRERPDRRDRDRDRPERDRGNRLPPPAPADDTWVEDPEYYPPEGGDTVYYEDDGTYVEDEYYPEEDGYEEGDEYYPEEGDYPAEEPYAPEIPY